VVWRQRFLCEIAITAHKYCLAHLLYPWACSWIEQLQLNLKWPAAWYFPRGDDYDGERLWIGWVFGDAAMLEAEMNKILCSMQVSQG
jgi:hypothetical protein